MWLSSLSFKSTISANSFQGTQLTCITSLPSDPSSPQLVPREHLYQVAQSLWRSQQVTWSRKDVGAHEQFVVALFLIPDCRLRFSSHPFLIKTPPSDSNILSSSLIVYLVPGSDFQLQQRLSSLVTHSPLSVCSLSSCPFVISHLLFYNFICTMSIFMVGKSSANKKLVIL